jgi:GT2 family glycosyltransferase
MDQREASGGLLQALDRLEHSGSASPIMPRVAVVMVNWNGWRDTVKAHASLQGSSYTEWRLIVVDNASTDDSLARLSALGPKATLIASPENAGFAGGCNIGIRAALAEGADYIFLLNNDATVRTETLERLVQTAVSTGEAILGCVIRESHSGELQYFGSRRSIEIGGPDWFTSPADLERLNQPLIETDFVFGAALFAASRLFQRIGLFDERFFLTFEETDWCYRAAALGVPRFVVTDAVADHAGSASMGSAASPLQAYFLQRNRLLFYEKHAGLRFVLRGLKRALQTARHGLKREFLGLLKGGRIDPARHARMIALRDYLIRRFGDCPAEIRNLTVRR